MYEQTTMFGWFAILVLNCYIAHSYISTLSIYPNDVQSVSFGNDPMPLGLPSSRLVLAVLNGGKRKDDYYTPLHERLLQLQSEHGYDLLALSDLNNYNPRRKGDVLMPAFPDELIFDHLMKGKNRIKVHAWKISIMWFSLVPLLLTTFPKADAFWITENDAHFCNATKLVDSFEWFLDNSTTANSLSYWTSCGNHHKVSNLLAETMGFDLYKRQSCGMVSTLFSRASLEKMESTLKSDALFGNTIEGIFSRSGTADVSLRNGQVLVHGGYRSNSGGEWGNYTCEDPEGVKFKQWEKEQAAIAIASGGKPKEYIG
mmetsp:Transcript_25697/g.74332  ORF Transcript_25697/g.74332 Transcript_25697/m.74332 type:complete len:314 (+) Transcript_25697:201-1142(+)